MAERLPTTISNLFDQAFSDHIIDPRDPPSFASLFQPRAHVLMSVHFESNEIPNLSRCPKCRMEQAYERDVETTCKSSNCGLRYRLERAKICDHWNKNDDASNWFDSVVASNICLGGTACKSVPKVEKDDSARFNRIIVTESLFTLDEVARRKFAMVKSMISNSSRVQYGTIMNTDDN